jgi:transposase
MDMSNSFKLTLELYYRKPCAIVHDRFHVIKFLHSEIDQIRRQEMQSATTKGAQQFLKGHRFSLLRACENLKPDKIDTLWPFESQLYPLCTIASRRGLWRV